CHIYNLVEPICKMEQLEFLEDDFKDTDLSSFILHVGDSSLNFGALQSEGATNRIWWIEWDLETLKFTNKLVAESNGSKMDIKNALEPFKSTQ
ncbi:MAG: hypothetical protein KDK27_01285, partial [Leptospiraceae bacterium]|nr:hypothetical protein [Leptospiraceae bacterium]